MVLITTSRRPSPRTRSLCKDLVRVIPESKQVNRGKTSSDRLLSSARLKGVRTLVVINSNKGNPSLITFVSTRGSTGSNASYEFTITRVKLQREFPETRFNRPRKLYVLVAGGSMELGRLGEAISWFLGGQLVRDYDIAKSLAEQSEDGLALILREESQDNVSISFAHGVNLQEIGPLISVNKKNAFSRLGGAYIE